MVTAIVLSPSLDAAAPAERAAEAVTRSLCALVRASMEGLVRDAIIVGPAADDLAAVADEAGCLHIEANTAREGFALALGRPRAHFVFVLAGGYAPQYGFVEEAADLLNQPSFSGALLRRSPDSLMTRIAPALAQPVGAVARQEALRRAAPRDLSDLIRRLKIRRALTSRADKLV